MIEVFAPAKINLTLHVTGRRADGYHLLDSLVVFGAAGDRLSFRDADRLSLTVTGPNAAGVPTDERNLVLQAAKLLDPTRGAEITLEKHLPHGGGIGGGSADAAAAIRGLCELWDMPQPDIQKALSLGADIPVCLQGTAPIFMSGIGEVLRPAPKLPPLWLVLVNPRIAVSTAEVFTLLGEMQGTDNPAMDPLDEPLTIDTFLVWLSGQRNDLTQCAAELAPEIMQILATFWNMESCADADMSGSGSTCRGVFETEAQARAAAEQFTHDHPDWWVEVSPIS